MFKLFHVVGPEAWSRKSLRWLLSFLQSTPWLTRPQTPSPDPSLCPSQTVPSVQATLLASVLSFLLFLPPGGHAPPLHRQVPKLTCFSQPIPLSAAALSPPATACWTPSRLPNHRTCHLILARTILCLVQTNGCFSALESTGGGTPFPKLHVGFKYVSLTC